MRWQARMAAVAVASVLGLGLVAPTARAEETPPPTATPVPTATPAPTETPTTPVPPAPPAPPAPPPTQDTLDLPMGTGDTGRYVSVLQERLEWMRYEIAQREQDGKSYGRTTRKAVRSFQSKYFLMPTGRVNQRTWTLLRKVATPVGWLPKACRTGTVLCIDKTQKLLRFVQKGDVVLTLDARFGASGSPTREGRFRVFAKSRDHWSSLYNTWMPFAMFFSGGQAVHYSPYFHRDGYFGASHGCIGLRDFDASRWLFDRVPLRTPVIVYRS